MSLSCIDSCMSSYGGFYIQVSGTPTFQITLPIPAILIKNTTFTSFTFFIVMMGDHNSHLNSFT